MKTKFFVPGVHCGHCIVSIESALAPAQGVRTVQVDLSSKSVLVEHETEVPALIGLIEEQGYDVAGAEEVA